MKLVTSLAVIAALTLPAISFANESGTQTGFAVLADVAIADIAIDAEGNYREESDTTTSPAIGVSYQFNENFSVLVQYVNYGTADLIKFSDEIYNTPVDLTVEGKTSAFVLAGQYMVPLAAQGWSLGGRVGLNSWNTDFAVVASTSQQSSRQKFADDSGTALIGGVLAEYAFNEQFALTFSADWFVNKIDDSVEFSEDGADLDMQTGRYAVGLKYSF